MWKAFPDQLYTLYLYFAGHRQPRYHVCVVTIPTWRGNCKKGYFVHQTSNNIWITLFKHCHFSVVTKKWPMFNAPTTCIMSAHSILKMVSVFSYSYSNVEHSQMFTSVTIPQSKHRKHFSLLLCDKLWKKNEEFNFSHIGNRFKSTKTKSYEVIVAFYDLGALVISQFQVARSLLAWSMKCFVETV